jgi:hypothetical protein
LSGQHVTEVPGEGDIDPHRYEAKPITTLDEFDIERDETEPRTVEPIPGDQEFRLPLEASIRSSSVPPSPVQTVANRRPGRNSW